MQAITLDQFTVFLTIVEEGSFAGAARKLGRAQSAITYAIQKLEDQSGVPLFDRSSYRPTLTEQGRALLPRVRRIIEDLGEFRVQAQSISRGVEAELVLLVETFLPLSMVTPALQQFHAEFPMVQVRIIAARPLDATQQLQEYDADLGLFLLTPMPDASLVSQLVTEMDFVAVAAPDHPLAKISSRVPQAALRDHLQIVVSNLKTPSDSDSFGVIGVNQWRVSEVRLRYELIRNGIGWGSMPRPMVEDDLAEGKLIELHPDQWDSSNTMPHFKVVVARHRDRALGPAGEALLKAITALRSQGVGHARQP